MEYVNLPQESEMPVSSGVIGEPLAPEIFGEAPSYDIDADFAAMDHSVATLNYHLNEDFSGLPLCDRPDHVGCIKGNCEHLEVMLAKPHILGAGRDLSVYRAAISAAHPHSH